MTVAPQSPKAPTIHGLPPSQRVCPAGHASHPVEPCAAHLRRRRVTCASRGSDISDPAPSRDSRPPESHPNRAARPGALPTRPNSAPAAWRGKLCRRGVCRSAAGAEHADLRTDTEVRRDWLPRHSVRSAGFTARFFQYDVRPL